MAIRAGDITFGVGFQVDKSGLQQLQQQLQQLQTGLKTTDVMKINNSSFNEAREQLTKIQATAQDVQNAMTNAFNPKINSLNLSKFQSELAKSGRTIQEIQQNLSLAGVNGRAAFRGIATQVLTTNGELKQTSKLIEDFGKTLKNSAKYTLSYGLINQVTGAFSSAFQYAKALDSSLNDIRIVTGKSADEMERFANKANKAAQALGTSTTDYTKASLIYYQQGLSDEEVDARTDVTLKAANVTGQSAEEVSEQLTAVWNGYKVNSQEAEIYVDKLAAVASTTASDLEELSTGMSKVASAANAMGVDVDQLNAQLATIVSVTRQAPESAGTALKTIYARMGDLELDGEDEFGVSLGEVSSSLESVGVNILDATGNLRDMGDVIEEVGNKWNSGAWSDAEKQALAIDLAGKRQYNNLLALFDNWDMYNDALQTSVDSQGTLQKQQDTYIESTAAHLETMQAAWEGVKSALLDADTLNPLIDAVSKFANILETVVSSLGGAQGMLVSFGAIALKAFAPFVGDQLSTFVNNLNIAKTRIAELETGMAEAASFQGAATNDRAVEYLVDQYKQLYDVAGNLTQEQYNQTKELMKTASEAKNVVENYRDMARVAAQIVNKKEKTSYTGTDLLNAQQTIIIENAGTDLKGQGESLKQLSKDYADGALSVDEFTQQLTEMSQEMVGIDATIDEMVQKLTQAQAGFEMATETATDPEIIASSFDNLQEKVNQLGNEVIQFGSDLEQVGRNFDNYSDKVNKFNTANKVLKDQQKKNKQTDDTATITKRISAVTQLASAYLMFQNLGSIWKNDDLSTGEKITQIIISGGMAIGMLISAFKAFGITATMTGVQVAAAGTVASIPWAWLIAIIGAVALVTAGLCIGIKTLTDSYNADANAAKALAEANKRLKESFDDINKSIDEFNNKSVSYQDAVDKLKTLTKGTDEYNDTLQEANRLAEELLDTNENLNAVRSNGLLTITNLANEEERLSKQQENQARIQNLSEVEATNAQQKANQTAFERSISTNLFDEDGYVEIDDASIEAFNKAMEERGGALLESEIDRIEGINDNVKLALKNNYDALKNNYDATKKLEETNRKLLEKNASDIISSNIGNYNDLSGSQTQFLTNAYAEIYEDEYEKSYSLENQQAKREAIRANFEKNNGINANEYARQYAAIMGYQFSYTDNEANDGTYQFLDMDGNPIEGISESDIIRVLALDQIEKEIEQTTQDAVDNIIVGANYLTNAGDELGIGIADTLLQAADTSQELVLDLTSDSLEALRTAGPKYLEEIAKRLVELQILDKKDAQAFVDNIQKAIDNVDMAKIYENDYKSATQSRDDASSILSSLKDGEEEDEAALNRLKTKYKDLDYLQQTNHHLYLERLRQIRQTEEDNAIKAIKNVQEEQKANETKFEQLSEQLDILQQQEKDARDKRNFGEAKHLQVEIEAKTDELEKTLEDIQKADYQIEIEVNTDLASDVDDVFGLANELEELKSLISDDLTYTMQEAQDLISQGYGAIFENCVQTADGLIKVDKGVLDSYIDNRQAEIESSKEAKRQELLAERAILVAKQEAAKAKLDAAQKALDAQTEEEAAAAYLEMANQQAILDAKNKELQEEVTGSEDAASDMEDINQDLYNSLGGMYEDNAENQQNADIIATDTNATNTNIRIENAKKEYNAWKQVAYAKTAEGEIDDFVDPGEAQGGQAGGTASSKGVNGNNTQKGRILSAPKDIESEAKKLFSENNDDTYKKTTQAIYNQANADYNMYTNQIGAIDAALAGLDASIIGLDKAQKEAGKASGSGSKDTIDLLEDEVDLYHDINLQLEEVEHNMKMLQKAEDKAFGKNYLDNLNQQNKLLERQQELLRQKLQLTANDMATKRAELALEGARFDSEGYLANYNTLLQERLDKVNALITAYNNLGEATTDEAKEANKTAKEQVEQAKKEYENLKSAIDNYDKLISQYQSLQESIQDAIDEQIENQIKAFNYEVDVRLDMAEATRDWNDFYEKVVADIEGIEDPVKKIITQMQTGLKNFETYFNGRDGLGSIQYLTEHVRETMAQVESIKNTGTSSVYGDNMSAAVEDLKKYNDKLMDNLEDAQDLINDIKDSYLDAIDEANDKLKEQTKQYEYIADLIKHDMNMVELLGGEDDYADLARYYEMMHSNNLQNVEFLRMQKDAIEAQLSAVDEGSEAWKKLYEQMQDAQKDLNSAVEDSLNNIIDKYSNAIKNVFDKLNKSVTGGLGLDYMQESYARQVDNGNNYLDDPNRLYSIEKIRNKYKDALNSTSDLAAQRKIAEVMAQQIEYLEEKDKLSQYEVDRAEKIYDLTMKQIALQEAQANKSQLRLKRDAQGNYNYQYVADQDAVNDAQQEVNDAMNDLYNFDLNNYRDILSQATDLTKEYEELVSAILENAALSEEERTQRLAEVKNWYYTEMEALEEQLAINKVNLQESANMELEELYRQNNEVFQGVLFEEMIPGWDDALDHMVTNFTEEFIPECEKSMQELEAETKIYQDEVDALAAQAGVDFALIKGGIDVVISATQAQMQSNQAVISTYNEEMNVILGVVSAMDQLIQRYTAAQQQAIATAEAAAKMWNALQLGAYSTAASEAIQGIANSIKDTAKELDNMGDAVSNTAKKVATAEREQKNNTTTNMKTTSIYEGPHAGGTAKWFGDTAGSSSYYRTSSSYYADMLKKIKAYDTGGYTGDWHASDGALAVLHQKELVLNAADTENILNAVSLIRSIDSAALARIAGMQINPETGSITAGLNGASAVDQNVTISATFPNVSSHSEIEQAFENLVNRASQAAWSTRV